VSPMLGKPGVWTPKLPAIKSPKPARDNKQARQSPLFSAAC